MNPIAPQTTPPDDAAPDEFGAPERRARALGLANVPLVVTAPTRAFAALAERPRTAWVGPMILVIVLNLLAAWIMLPQTLDASYEMTRSAMERFNVPEDDVEAALAKMPLEPTGEAFVRQAVSNVAILPLFLVAAGALVHLLTRMLGAHTRFSTTLGMFCLSNVVLALGNVVQALVVSAADSIEVTLGPGALLPDLDLYSPAGIFLDAFNVFGIWFLFVFVKGLRGVGGLRGGTAWAAGGTYWVLRVLFLASTKVFVAWSRGG